MANEKDLAFQTINVMYPNSSWKASILLWLTTLILTPIVIHIILVQYDKKQLNYYINDIWYVVEQADFQIEKGLDLGTLVESEECDKKDMEYLRYLMDQYYFIGDLGRINGDLVTCTVQKGLLEEPLSLSDPEVISTSGIRYWNGQKKLFVEDGEDPILAKGDTVLYISKVFLNNIDLFNSEKTSGFGGVLYAKDLDFVFRVFGDVNLNDIDIYRSHENSILDYIPGADQFINTTKCNDQTGLCLMAVGIKLGFISLPIYVVFILFSISVTLGFLFSNMHKEFRTGHRMFVKKLRRAVKRSEVYPVYQPKVELSSGKIIGVEALARWHDKKMGLVSTELFITIAEGHNLIDLLARNFIQTVFKDLSDTLENNKNFSVSVNITPETLIDSDFIEFLDSEISKYGFGSEQVVLEITERTTSNSNTMSTSSNEVSRHGYLISLDDFGTGFSNLSWLTTLEPDEIKIDKMFTQAIDTETVNNITLNGMFNLIKSLDVKVVFEGIELENQLVYIKEKVPGAVGQGWLLYKPMRAEALFEILKKHL